MGNVPDYDVDVNEFEFQSSYFIYFRTEKKLAP